MSQEITDADHDYLSERCEISRILTPEQQKAETRDIPTQPQAVERETRIAIAACMIAGGALVLVLCDVPWHLGRLWGSM